MSDPPPRLRFTPKHRLGHAREFARVFEHRLRATRGPITLHAIPNGLAHHRLGLSIGRRVGSAVRRNRLKRHLREAFRLSLADLPKAPEGGGFDLVVSARAHDPWPLDRYRQTLAALLTELAGAARRRSARAKDVP